MNLLWNLFRAVFLFSLSAVALAAVLAHPKRFFLFFLKIPKILWMIVKTLWHGIELFWNVVIEKGIFRTVQVVEQKIIASIRRNWTISGAIILTIVLLYIGFDVIKPSFPWVEPGEKEPQWTPNGEFVARIVTPLFVFIISFLSMMRVFRQFKIQVEQVRNQAEKARMEMAAEQFKNAIDHLGNEKQSVVLGGVHALHNLAMNFPDDYGKQVFEVLCSFIREETRKPEYRAKIEAMLKSTDQTQKTETNAPNQATSHIVIDTMQIPLTKSSTSLIVLQTIVDKLFREKVEVKDEKTGKTKELYRNHAANLSNAFLREVNFSDAQLQSANLQNANLQGANLSGTNLQRAHLSNANLQWAGFWKANLQQADLWGANLQQADLWGANLQWAGFREANMQGAVLSHANLQGAVLRNANLQGAKLFLANLQRADLRKANLQGADLSHANLQGAKLGGANLQGATLVGAIFDEDEPP